MRTIILSMSVTLDGYVEGPNKDMSWMRTDDPEDWAYLFKMLEDVDLLLVGGGMYTEYRDYWKKVLTQPHPNPDELAYAQFAARTPHIVFSKSLQHSGWGNTTIEAGDAVAQVARIKQQPGRSIYLVGGATFPASLINAGLVDEYRLMVNPAMTGGGKSFFRQVSGRYDLELVSAQPLTSGSLLLQYRDHHRGPGTS